MGLKVTVNEQKMRDDGRCAMRLYVYVNGKHCYLPLKDLYCRPEDIKNGRIQTTHPNCEEMNIRISEVYNRLEKLIIQNPRLDARQIIAIYNNAPSGIGLSFYGFVDDFILKQQRGRVVGEKRIASYKYARMRLYRFAPNLTFDDINIEFIESFSAHLRVGEINNPKYGDKRRYIGKLSQNSLAEVIKILQGFLSQAKERGVYAGIEHEKGYFAVRRKDTPSIYLNEHKMKLLESVDLRDAPLLHVERDRFVAAYYFLNRHSDSIRIDRSMFFMENGREFIRMKTKKTKEHIMIPVKPSLKHIMERNDYKFNRESLTTANKKIKEIGRLAGFEEKILLGDRYDYEYNFISTHTARRSGATNLYLRGVDIRTISKLLGHRSIATTEKYICVSSLQTALTMADHPFYQ